MSTSSISLDKSMKAQIVSMLNDVMIDENTSDNEEEDITINNKMCSCANSDCYENEKDTNNSNHITFSKDKHNKNNMSIRHQYNNHNEYTNYGKRSSNNKHYKSHTNQHLINNNNNNSVNMSNYCSLPQYVIDFQTASSVNSNIIGDNMNLHIDDSFRNKQYNMLFNSHMQFVYNTNNNNNLLLNRQFISQDDQIFAYFETYLTTEGKFTYKIYQTFKNEFIRLIKNQQTSRTSQLYIQHSPPEIIHLLYTEISSHISQLLLDPYANYFILKLFSYLDNSDCLNFLNQISKTFTYLCINKISTYPIQCIVEHINSKHLQEIIIDSVKNHLMKITLDIYGTHVLEKIISKFDYELIQPISKFVVDNFLFLANNANGLCIVKKTIEVEYKKNYFEKIKQLTKDNALVLIQNPFGNYALQCVIDNWDNEDINDIINVYIGKCSLLSIQKYSSNVIEKCIEKSNMFLKEFINECIDSNYDGIGVLMQNNYGNYVIQTALKVTTGTEREEIIIGLEKNLEKITNKKIISKWKHILVNSHTNNNHK